ncbi:hypothetical protein PIB30_051915 [Stylosanthes scabra]|uniref:Uncharacterized protein n=1 Tax=Stylosanthes scabra TaxID=79078 RepID=A0ABU6QHP5_9FABA|nr:hypothetical protein [Stylosanthes scabra]
MLGSYRQPINKPLLGFVLVAKDDSSSKGALKKPTDYTLKKTTFRRNWGRPKARVSGRVGSDVHDVTEASNGLRSSDGGEAVSGEKQR